MAQIKNVEQFLLKKFPTNKYFACPVPKRYWDIMQEYADHCAQQQKVSSPTPKQLEDEAVEFAGYCLKEDLLPTTKNYQIFKNQPIG